MRLFLYKDAKAEKDIDGSRAVSKGHQDLVNGHEHGCFLLNPTEVSLSLVGVLYHPAQSPVHAAYTCLTERREVTR